MRYLLIFAGGGIGAILRYLLSSGLQRAFEGLIFPIGTFVVNMIGCFFIGLVMEMSQTKALLQGETRIFLTVGLLGGFTTFSSFGYETMTLMRDGQYLEAGSNAVLQVVLGLLLVWIGGYVGRMI